MVSEYRNNTQNYKLNKLVDRIWLFDYSTFDVNVDNGEAYVNEIEQEPLALDVRNLKVEDTSALNERQQFTHNITFTLQGYANNSIFQGMYYVVIKSVDGTFWLVNPFFPCKVTYTYTLGDNENHTDFTLATASNFPTLKANGIDGVDSSAMSDVVCQYRNSRIMSLRMNEGDFSAHQANRVYYTNDGFKDVVFSNKSLRYTENFDSVNVQHTIEFQIDFDKYKSSWHYNLLEFQQNTYAAIIRTSDNKYILAGFGFHLQPSFSVSADDTTTPNVITITLTDSHNTDDLTDVYESVTEEYLEGTKWVYTKKYGFECVSANEAEYILQEEQDALDNPTGRYQCLNGYQDRFDYLNIIGTFSQTQYFFSSTCGGSDDGCLINTTLSSIINFNDVGCKNFIISGSSSWSITSSNSNVTVSPSNGVANQQYSIIVCNNIPVTETAQEATLTLRYCGQNTEYTVRVQESSGCLYNNTYTITGAGQYLQIPISCCVTDAVDEQGIIVHPTITSSYIKVYVPKCTNETRTITLRVDFCDGTSQNVTILQNPIYEEWRQDGWQCSGQLKCDIERKYTGNTSSSLVRTDETRMTNCRQSSECVGQQTRWVETNPLETTCSGGKKYALDKEQVSTNGTTWTDTGAKRLGRQLEDPQGDCQGGGGGGYVDGDLTVNGTISGTTVKGITISGQTIYGDDGIFNSLKTEELSAVTAIIQNLLADNITTDYLTVTKAAHFFSLIIDEIKSVGGQVIITPANAEIVKVDDRSSYYRLYFLTEDDRREIHNQFEINDQVVCATFNVATGTSYNLSNQYYWRLCVGKGTSEVYIDNEDTSTGKTWCHYIDLSKSDYDAGSMTPKVGDKVCQLGNRRASDRQNAIILSAYNSQFLDGGLVAPSIVQYSGINNYNLTSHRLTVISNGFNSFKGDFITNDNKNVASEINTMSGNVYTLQQNYSTVIQNEQQISQTVGEHTVALQNLNQDIEDLEHQIKEMGEVGGVNLIRNSKLDNVDVTQTTPFKKGRWSKWGTPYILEFGYFGKGDATVNWCHTYVYAGNYWQGVVQTPYDRWGVQSINEGFKPNQYYTLSFDAYGSGKIGAIVHFRDANNTNVGQYNTGLQDITQTPTRYSFTFTTTDDNSIVQFAVMIGVSTTGTTTDNNIYFSRPKLELGETATDWSPSPYDTNDTIITIEDHISSIEQTARQIDLRVSSAETNISTLSGDVRSTQQDVADLQIEADGITSTVESVQTDVGGLYNGDTKNKFGESSYNGLAISDTDPTNKWEFVANCSYVYDNITKHNTPLVKGLFEIEQKGIGNMYLYSPAIQLFTAYTYSLTCDLITENINGALQLIRYPSRDNAIANINGTIEKSYLTGYTSAGTSVYATWTPSNNFDYAYNQLSYRFKPNTNAAYYRIRVSTSISSYVSEDDYLIEGGKFVLYQGAITAGDFMRWDTTYAKTSSMIQQTANDITMAVNDVSLKIDNKGIELNGDTKVNGTLTLNDQSQGFLLAGSGGTTSISPQSVGTYNEFLNRVSANGTKYLADNVMQLTAGQTTLSYNFGTINFGNVVSGKVVTLQPSMTFQKQNSGTIYSPNPITTTVRLYNGTTLLQTYTRTGAQPSIIQYTATTAINLNVTMTISATFTSENQDRNIVCKSSIAYNIPTDAFALLGFDGLGLNFGNNRIAFFNKDGTVIRYGNYAFRITPNDGIQKSTNGGSSWINL